MRQKIYLFGGFRSEPALNVSGRAPQRLLTFLLLWPDQAHRRDSLVEQLWPHTASGRGRRRLSDALYQLRRTLPVGWLEVDRETITFLSSEGLWVDVWAFDQLAAEESPASLAEAAALYQGELALGLEDDWIWARRERAREQVTAVLLSLAAHLEDTHQFDQAANAYRRLITLDDMHETAQQGLMRALARQDRLAESLAVYQRFQQFLADELQVAPTLATQQLAAHLQAEWDLRQRSTGQLTAVPFVGRTAERSRLLTRLDEARAGRGGLVVLLGEAGIGKTRLLEFLAQSADWRGWQVAWGQAEEFVLPRPYAPLADVLTAVLPRPRRQQISRLVPGWWLALIARIVPALADEGSLPGLPEAGLSAQQLAQATYALLAGLQQIAPHLLILDDVQWSDPVIWPLLTELHAALADTAVLIVVSGRTSSLQTNPAAWEAIHTWEEGGAVVLRLGGLEPPLLAELARAVGRGGLAADELAHLRQISGGNPLLALSLLEMGESLTAVPQSPLVAMQRRRLAGLSDAALLVLQAAAVLGYRFDYALWEAVVSGIQAADLPALAGELEQRRFLSLEEDAYRFQHDTLRACVYQDIPPERRPLLHHRALAAYQQRRPQETLALLYHAGQCGAATAVAQYALQAGQSALNRFAYRDAAAYFTQALDALPPDEPRSEYAALAGRVRAWNLLGEHVRLQADLARLQTIAEQLADDRLRAEVTWRAAEMAWFQGDQAGAARLAEAGLALAQQAGDEARQAAFLETLGRIARNRGDYHQARAWITQAYERFTAVGDRFGQASTLDKLANLAFEGGDSAQAATKHAEAAQIFRELGAVPYESRALSGRALALKAMGQYDEARQTHQQILTTTVAFGDRHSQWVQLVLLGNIAFELGDYETAVQWYTQALDFGQQLKNPRDLTMTLNNLGEAYREKSEPETALRYYQEALAINRLHGYQRGEAHSLNGLGLAYLARRQLAAARDHLENACALWQALGERLKLTESSAGLALAALGEGDLDEAQERIDVALQGLSGHNDHPMWRRWVYFAAYQVWLAAGGEHTAVAHLCRAAQALAELAARIPSGEHTQFFQQIRINREIQAALMAHAQVRPVRLVKAHVPLGQKLGPDDYTPVNWTLYVPTDEAYPPGPERRRQVLKRLLAEAAAQGGAPTDADLAAAMQTSRRTILRDMQTLAGDGLALPTRRRRPA